jgi:ribosome biogenesis GTPase
MTFTARVLRSTGSWYEVVELSTGVRSSVRAAGRLRLAGDRATNPIAVGDRVDVEEKGIIVSIHPRRNVLQRKAVNLSHAVHTLAANLDAAFLVVTAAEPVTSTGFIDRFLVSAEAFGVPTTLVFNKRDACSAYQQVHASELQELYAGIGYSVIETSAVTGAGVDRLRADLAAGGTSLLAGNSGVGKSSLLNVLIPGSNVRVGAVSEAHAKGTHTTTYAEMYALPDGGYVVDSPGVKSFGLADIDRDSLHHYFPEFFRLLPQCKFHNCRHLNEPGCMVRIRANSGQLPRCRYDNYQQLSNEIQESKRM